MFLLHTGCRHPAAARAAIKINKAFTRVMLPKLLLNDCQSVIQFGEEFPENLRNWLEMTDTRRK